MRQQPGVKDAAFTSLLPLNGEIDNYGVHVESDADPRDDGAALRYAVTPEYFGVMREGLVRWAESKSFASIDDVRGRLDGRATDADLFERANYIRTLQSWTA